MNKPRPKYEKLILSAIAATIIVAVSLLLLQIANTDKIARGLTVSDIELSGLTQIEAAEKLNKFTENFLKSNLIIVANGQNLNTTPEALGLNINSANELNKAYSIGRNNNIIFGVLEQLGAFSGFLELTVEPTINEEKFNVTTKNLFYDIEQWPKDADVIYDPQEQQFNVSPEKNGNIIDRSVLKEQILQRASKINNAPILINTVPAEPSITANMTEEARLKASTLIKHNSFSLIFEKNSWPVDTETLIDWIIFEKKSENNIISVEISADDSSIEEYLLKNIAHQIDIDAQNAQLTLENGKVTLFKPSRNGRELDIKNSIAGIKDSVINQTKTETAAEIINKKTINLVVKERIAEITTKSINDLGISELLATGESNFTGSPKNRVHNISVGATKFNGVLIKPGTEFSFNTTLGPVDASTGYKPELVIKQNITVPEYGGGLCQVATTMFRAAVYSGLTITKRYPHAYPVKYYGTPGFDATIYPPNPDLKFINDTPGHILIQTKIVGTKLIFEFYGTSDGRETEVTGPVVTKKGADGSAEAYLKQKVTRNGEIIIDKTFYSKYRSPKLYPVATRNPLE